MSDEGAPASRVLIAEDERHLGVLLEQFLVSRGHAVTLVHDGRAALHALSVGTYDVALLDVQMPERDGLAVLREARELPLPPQVVVVTGNGTADTAIAAMQSGAYDYVAKPYRMVEVELLVRRATERRRLAAIAVGAETLGDEDALETGYAPLRAVLSHVEAAAAALVGAMVHGEPGTGRMALARRVHRLAGGGPFVVLDARTDDARDPWQRARRIASARAGTLVVRAIDALTADARAALAAALDGSHAGSMRVIATSTSDAAEPPDVDTLSGALSALVVELPPLRDRVGDVSALAERFARRFAVAAPPSIAASAADRLERHAWPGNVAELRLVMEGAVARAARSGAAVIEPAHLGLDSVRHSSSTTSATPP